MIRKPGLIFSLIVVLVFYLVQGCTFSLKPTRYATLDALIEARNKLIPPIKSIKALASVNLKVNDRGAQFPEAVIISSSAMRLETLNIFYQPLLIIVYNNDKVTVLDVNTGVCSIGSSDLLSDYTMIDVTPQLFERLVTGQLPATPETFTATTKNIIVSGKYDQSVWFSELNDNMIVMSTTMKSYDKGMLMCTYKAHDIINGVPFPVHVICQSGGNRLIIHYTKVKVNVEVEPVLIDPDSLCKGK